MDEKGLVLLYKFLSGANKISLSVYLFLIFSPEKKPIK